MSTARVRSTENYGRQIRGKAEAVNNFIEQPALGGRYRGERYGGGWHNRSLAITFAVRRSIEEL